MTKPLGDIQLSFLKAVEHHGSTGGAWHWDSRSVQRRIEDSLVKRGLLERRLTERRLTEKIVTTSETCYLTEAGRQVLKSSRM